MVASFVWLKHEMLHVVEECNIEGHGFLAMAWSFAGCQFILVGVYMKSGEGLQGRINSQLWAKLIAFLRNIQQPFVVMGDFNEQPEEVNKTDLIIRAGGEILCTQQETTTAGSELDSPILSRHIHPISSIMASWQVPCRPHCMIVVEMEAEFDRIKVPQLRKFPTIPRMNRPDWQWRAFVGQDHDLELLGQEVTPEAKSYARWASHAEAYALQDMEDAKLGRGRKIVVETKELVSRNKTWLWKRGGMAYWGQLLAILQSAKIKGRVDGKTKKQIEKYLIVMEKHWRGENGLNNFQDKLWHLTKGWQELLSVEVEQLATEQEKQTRNEVLQEEAEAYREWLKQGYTSGYKQLFKCLKRGEEAFLRPFSEIPYEERIEARVRQWNQLWIIQKEPHHLSQEEEIYQKAQDEARTWDSISVEYAMKVIKKLGQKAAGIDGVSNELLKCLPWEGIQDLLRIMEDAERTANPPEQWTTSLIVLIPKNTVIERPIALVSVVHRLWCRLRNEPIRQWQKTLDQLMPSGTISARKPVLVDCSHQITT